jgi:hypothetical protein
MKNLDRVSRNCLSGQALPDDLRQLWAASKAQPWYEFVPFTLVDQPDDDFFTGYREADGVPTGVATVYRRMFQHIAFVGKREDGELVGYWLGPAMQQPIDSPIVELDTEGQFRLKGRNLGEYLLACTFTKDDFVHLRRILTGLGLAVEAKTRSELLDTFNTLDGEFGDPNWVSARYERGLDALPASKVRFGFFKFPAAAAVLRELGVEGVTAGSTQAKVIKLLGPATAVGGDIEDKLVGYIEPWIRYKRPDCQIQFNFKKRGGVSGIHVIDSDWGTEM